MDPDPDPAARSPLTAGAPETRTTPETPSGIGPGARGLVRAHGGTVLLALVTAAAIVPRVLLWWQDRAFWRDEVALIQSLDTFGLGELVGPLADAQTAPPLWLVAIRGVTTVLGRGEQAYRLIPLVAGCASLVLLAVLAGLLVRRRWTAAVPVAVAGTVSESVFYAVQTKPYTVDVVLVTALLVLGVLLLRTGSTDLRVGLRVTWYVLIAVGAWLSYGVMICAPLLAGWVLAVQLRRRRIRRRPIRLGRAAAELAVPAASVLAAALWARHLTGQVGAFATYWADFLGPPPLDPGGLAHWHRFVFSDLFTREVGARWWLPALVLVAAGLVVLLRRDRSAAVLVVLPLVAAYLVGVGGAYPFGRRLVMFCVPGLLVCLAVLVDASAGLAGRLGVRLRRHGMRGVAVALGGLLATAAVLACAWTTPARLSSDLTYLYGVDDYRGAFGYVAAHWRSGDVLVVGNGDRAAARVYLPRVDLPHGAVWRASATRDADPRRHCHVPEPIASAPRVWLLTDDVVPIYGGTISRAAIVAPMLDRFHVDHRRVKGLVTAQLLLPGRSPDAEPARCLAYAPLGRA